MIVAIDGPVGVGKTSVAREVAKRLGFLHIDTGAMYRALALRCREEGLDPNDSIRMADLANRNKIDLEPSPTGPRVLCNGEDVTEAIRSPEVSDLVSRVSAHPELRQVVAETQRAIGQTGSVVMEGRDIGTVVFPDADVKIYMDASLEARVQRRTTELEAKGIPCSIEEVKRSIAARDEQDCDRETSPLRIAEGAVVLDTTDFNFEEVVDKVVEIVRETIRRTGNRH